MGAIGLAAQLAVNGLIAGSLYALLAVSWGLIFFTTKTFHIAHAFIFTACAYLAIVLVNTAGVPLAAALVLAALFGAASGAACERWLYRPLRRVQASQLNIFLASLGFLVAGESAILIGFGPNAQSLQGFALRGISIGPIAFTTVDLLLVVGSWVLIVGILLWLKRTRFGRAVRAVASNPELAHSFGIDANRVFLVVYGLGSALAAAAAIFFTLRNTASPVMGLPPVLGGIIGVFLGGIGSLPGSALGGIVLGLAENMGGLVLPGHWQGAIAFLVLFVVIVFWPNGLLGQRSR